MLRVSYEQGESDLCRDLLVSDDSAGGGHRVRNNGRTRNVLRGQLLVNLYSAIRVLYHFHISRMYYDLVMSPVFLDYLVELPAHNI